MMWASELSTFIKNRLSPRVFGLLHLLLLSAAAETALGAGSGAQSISAQTQEGQLVCNTSGAFSQVPGNVDMFVGRGFAIGSLDECHRLASSPGFLALFKMDWVRHILLMQSYLLKPPIKTPLGLRISSAYDPYVATYRGEIWVAFECVAPGAVSSCIAPLTKNLSAIDLSRLSIVAEGTLGPNGPAGQVVGLMSASAPTLFSYQTSLYLYWQVDFFDNQLPQNHLISRGMQLEEDTQGRLWGLGSGKKPVQTDDPHLTFLVHDVKKNDVTADHVAATSDTVIAGQGIIEVASIGGTGGKQVCRSTHDDSPGCWRMGLSLANAPLGDNIFGQHMLPDATLPVEIVEYPRFIKDPSGHPFLMGNFQQPVAAPINGRAPPLAAHGLMYIPFNPSEHIP